VEKDPHIYSFAYGNDWPPYESINDDGELVGLSYDLVRSVCQVMNKECVHTVFYNYDDMWNGAMSKYLNNRWVEASPGWLNTARRMAAYGFFGAFSNPGTPTIYARRGSGLTVKEIQDNSNTIKIGFRAGFWTSTSCFEKAYGGVKAEMYPTNPEMAEALSNGEVDALFSDGGGLDTSDMEIVDNSRTTCGGVKLHVMARKDMVHKFEWFDIGLQKIRKNGEMGWICNHYGADARCIEK